MNANEMHGKKKKKVMLSTTINILLEEPLEK